MDKACPLPWCLGWGGFGCSGRSDFARGPSPGQYSFRAMLNYIWLGLMVLAVVIGGCTDHLKEVADKSFEMAEFAVMKISLPLVGIMALWLGIMRLAERAGLKGLEGLDLSELLTKPFTAEVLLVALHHALSPHVS